MTSCNALTHTHKKCKNQTYEQSLFCFIHLDYLEQLKKQIENITIRDMEIVIKPNSNGVEKLDLEIDFEMIDISSENMCNFSSKPFGKSFMVDSRPSTGKSFMDIDGSRPSTGKSFIDIDDSRPSTGKSFMDIDGSRPSTGKSMEIDILTNDASILSV